MTVNELFYTPDQWPQVEAHLAATGITRYERQRLDLNNAGAGWRTVARVQPGEAPAPSNALDTAPLDTAAEMRLLNRIFREHKLGVEVDPLLILDKDPSMVIYGLKLGAGARINAVEMRLRELSEALGRHRRKLTPVRLRANPLALETPHPQLQPLPLPAKLALPPGCGAVGDSYSFTGKNIELVDMATTAHMLIAGTTGSGKSTLLASLLLSLCAATPPDQLRLVLIDLKNEDLVPFANLPHCNRLAIDSESAEAALEWVYREKDHRVAGGRQKYQRLVLVIDELAELMHDSAVTRMLASILAIGRSKGIHCIAATQKPTAAVVGSIAKANFTTRFVGRVLSPDDSRVAAGQRHVGAEQLPGAGAFIRIDGADLRRFQAYYVSAGDVEHAVANIKAKWTQQAPIAWGDAVMPEEQPRGR